MAGLRVLFTLVLSLTLLAWSVVQGQISGNRATSAIDFYYVIDGSLSISDGDVECRKGDPNGPTCMELIAQFTNATIDRMVTLAGGLYKSEEENGVRVGMVVFQCSKYTVLLEPSNGINRTAIEGAVTTLAAVEPDGETCSSQSLKWVKDEIARAEQEMQIPRKNAILYVTDGALGRFDQGGTKPGTEWTKTNDAVKDLLTDTNTTALFGLGIDLNVYGEAELEILTQDPGFVWEVSEPGALENVVDALVSYIFGDFLIELADGVRESDVCMGDNVMIEISGASVLAIEKLVCKYQSPDIIEVVVDNPENTGVWRCPVPESLYSGESSEVVVVEMFSRSGSVDRKLGENATTFNLARKPCVGASVSAENVLPEGSRCLGERLKYSIAGPTVAGISALDAKGSIKILEVGCTFTLASGGSTITTEYIKGRRGDIPTEPEFLCDLSERSASDFTANGLVPESTLDVTRDGADLSLDVFAPFEILAFELRVQVDNLASVHGISNAVSVITVGDVPVPSNDLALDNAVCLQSETPSAACWRDPNPSNAGFSGNVIDYVHESGLEVVCLFQVEDSFILSEAAKVSDTELECPPPVKLFDPLPDSGLRRGRDLKSNLLLLDGNGKALQLSNMSLPRTVTFASCVGIVQEGETCFGDSTVLQLTSSKNVEMIRDDVSCYFEDTLNEISVTKPVEISSDSKGELDNRYQCSSPDTTGQYFGVSFQYFELRANDVPIDVVKLTNSTNCFTIFTRLDANDAFALLGSREDGDVRQCWLDAKPGKTLKFTGKTPEQLQNEQATCIFSGGEGIAGWTEGSEVSVSAIWSNDEGGMLCDVPDEVFNGAPGHSNLTVKLRVDPGPSAGNGAQPVLILEETLQLQVDPCLTLETRNGESAPLLPLASPSVDFDIDQCWQSDVDGVTIFFKGTTAQKLYDESTVKCVFQGGRGVIAGDAIVYVPFVGNAEGFQCDIPADVFKGLGGETTDATYSTAYTVSLEIDGAPLVVNEEIRLRANTQSPCLEYDVVPASPTEHVCMGTQVDLRVVGGTSFSSLLGLINQDSFPCAYDQGFADEVGEKANGTLACPMPLYSSFPNKNVEAVILADTVVRLLPLPSNQNYDGPECLEPVIAVDPQTLENRRVLQSSPGNKYCLGDGLSTTFEGLSIAFLTNSFSAGQLKCEWQPATQLGFVSDNQTAVVTQAIVDGESLKCESPTWEPWSEQGLAQGAYASVQLLVQGVAVSDGTSDELVDEPVALDGDYEAQVCSEPGWANGLSDEQSDCKRSEVSMVLAGRSAVALSKAPSGQTNSCWGGENTDKPLMCEFLSANPDQDPSYALPLINGTEILCSAGGWRPDAPEAGNYVQVRLAVCLDDGMSKSVVKQRSFAPTSGRECLTLGQSQGCPGEPIDFVLSGPTVSAFWAYMEENGEALQCVGGAVPPIGGSRDSGPQQLVCRLEDSFDVVLHSDKSRSLEFKAGSTHTARKEEVTVQILLNDRTCLNPNGESSCTVSTAPDEPVSGQGDGGQRLRALSSREEAVAFTNVAITGKIVDHLKKNPDHLVTCEFSKGSSNSRNVTKTATIQMNNETGVEELVCNYEGVFNYVSLDFSAPDPQDPARLQSFRLFQDEPLVVSGTPSLCLAAVAPPTVPQEPSSNAGAIAGGVIAVLVLIALVAFFVVRNRKKEDDESDLEAANKNNGAYVAPEASPAEPLSHAFGVGDRVEALGDWNPESLGTDEKGWFKGTVSEDNLDGTFTIALDVLDAGMATGTTAVVAAADLRVPASDFRQGDIVEARHGGGQMWYAAVVQKVNINDSYDVAYEETESLGEEKLVAGSLLRAPVMIFQPGNLVEVKNADGRFERATVRAVDITAEQYTVAIANSSLLAESDPTEEEPEDEVRTVAAPDVRAFIPEVGELMDVHLEDTVEDDSFDNEEARATVVGVDMEKCTATVAYVNEATANELNCPTTVPWHALYRPFFCTGDNVEAQQALSPAAQAAADQGKTWLPGRITGVQSSDNTYTVAYEDDSLGEEAGITVDRLRAAGLYDRDMNASFAMGQLVKVQCSLSSGPEAPWYKAEITGVNDDGTYDISFHSGPEAGNEEIGVPVSRIRSIDADEVDDVDVQLEASPYANIFRPPPRDHSGASEDDGLQVPFHLRFKKRKPLDFHELPNNQFEVKLDMSEGLGLSLGWTKDSRVIVAGFRDLPNGDWGPVEACGLVGLKDQLLKVNSHSIGGKSFVEVSELIKNSGKTIRLQFGRWTEDDAIQPGAHATPTTA